MSLLVEAYVEDIPGIEATDSEKAEYIFRVANMGDREGPHGSTAIRRIFEHLSDQDPDGLAVFTEGIEQSLLEIQYPFSYWHHSKHRGGEAPFEDDRIRSLWYGLAYITEEQPQLALPWASKIVETTEVLSGRSFPDSLLDPSLAPDGQFEGLGLIALKSLMTFGSYSPEANDLLKPIDLDYLENYFEVFGESALFVKSILGFEVAVDWLIDHETDSDDLDRTILLISAINNYDQREYLRSKSSELAPDHPLQPLLIRYARYVPSHKPF